MDPLDAMAMEEMMGGAPMDAGMGEEMVPVMVPSWAVPAVEELVSILMEEGAGGAMEGMGEELAF